MNQEEDEKFFMDTVQTQQVEIESLKKQIRVQEFQQKQLHLEFTNAMDQVKKRNEELEKELHQQIQYADQTKIQQFALSMQDQLAKAEEQILIYQENEIKYIKEIQQLQMSEENDKIEDLKQQLQKMEETAIALIVEKEVIISEQAREIELLKNQYDHIAQPQQIIQQQSLIDIQTLEKKLLEYQTKIDFLQQQHEDELVNQERLITNRIFESLEQEMNQTKLLEQDLLHQINIIEEKNKYYEKLINEYEKKFSQLKEEKLQEQLLNEKRYQEISERLRNALKQVLKSDKKCEEAYCQFSSLQREKQNLIKQKEELIRKQVYLENQNRKNLNAIQQYKELTETFQQQISEQDQQINDLNEQIMKLTQHYEQQLKIIQVSKQKFEFSDQEINVQQNMLLSDILKDSQLSQPQHHENVHQDSPTQSISQTPTSHLSDSYCSFQIKNSARRKGQQYKYENIKDALIDAKHTIKIQNLEISNLEQTVEILQKELKSQLLEIHNLRKTKLDFTGEKDQKLEIEKLKQGLNLMETHFLTTKLSLAEEVNFLKDELKRAEQESLQSKLNLTKLNSEYCILQQRIQRNEKNEKAKQIQNRQPTFFEESPNKGKKGFFSLFK